MTIVLTDHQHQAVKKVLDWYKDADRNRYQFETRYITDLAGKSKITTMLGKGQDFFFGGYSGTGKSSVVPFIIDDLGLQPDDVAFVGPTGKSALVLGKKLRNFGMRVSPTTIHKLIYLPKSAHADKLQASLDSLRTQIVNFKSGKQKVIFYKEHQLDLAGAEKACLDLNFQLIRAMENDDGPQFTLRDIGEFPEQVKLIVVDEGSMVGAEIAQDLASFGRPILAFGDPGQLPPVNDDYGFHCTKPDAFLTEIHRQAKDNPIIRLATLARNGDDIPYGDYGDGVKVVKPKNDDVTLNMDREAMIICGTHKKRWALTTSIRKALGYTETGPGEGEPLLFCKNSAKLEGMVNGTIVTCARDTGDLVKGRASFMLEVKDPESGATHKINVNQGIFEEHMLRKRNAYTAGTSEAFKSKRADEQLDFGHVLTCHKSQGSEWEDVVVHDESMAFRDDANRWLYTAITRSSDKLTLVV